MTELMKDIALHPLRGDIQQIGMETDYNKLGLRKILERRFVRDTKGSLPQAEFDSVLEEEYKKVTIWRGQQKARRAN